MLEVKRKLDGRSVGNRATRLASARVPESRLREGFPEKIVPAEAITSLQSNPLPFSKPSVKPGGNGQEQTRVPVLVGEAHFRGTLPVDGIVQGQLGTGNGSLNVRQRSRAAAGQEPELAGEIHFRDMLRVNGFIEGSVFSEKGTLIVDVNARVDADVEVGIAVISGMLNGDIVAHRKVEIGPNAKIYGNIWTKSIEIKDGAIFEGVCRMIE